MATNGIVWKNPETKAAYRDITEGTWEDDINEVAAEWLSADSVLAPVSFGRQLRTDFHTWYRVKDEKFVDEMILRGLARVDWRQIASYLIRKCRGRR